MRTIEEAVEELKEEQKRQAERRALEKRCEREARDARVREATVVARRLLEEQEEVSLEGVSLILNEWYYVHKYGQYNIEIRYQGCIIRYTGHQAYLYTRLDGPILGDGRWKATYDNRRYESPAYDTLVAALAFVLDWKEKTSE